MKIHIFYRKSLDEYNDVNTMYAYTENKEYADKFIQDRNMDMFIYRKKNISKSEFKELKNKYWKYQLKEGGFYTFTNYDIREKVIVNLICTWEEESSVQINGDRLWQEYSKHLFDCKAFKSEYIKALEYLLFPKFYTFYNVKHDLYMDYFYDPYVNSFCPEELIYDDFTRSFVYDELKMFIKFYKWSFKVKED